MYSKPVVRALGANNATGDGGISPRGWFHINNFVYLENVALGTVIVAGVVAIAAMTVGGLSED